jgi:hypothetical protein
VHKQWRNSIAYKSDMIAGALSLLGNGLTSENLYGLA